MVNGEWQAHAAIHLTAPRTRRRQLPSAVEFEAAARAIRVSFTSKGIERLDWVQANVRDARGNGGQRSCSDFSRARRRVTASSFDRTGAMRLLSRESHLSEMSFAKSAPPRSAIEMLRSVPIKKYSAKRSDLNSG